MNSVSANKPVMVNLNIGDELTTISCGHVVVELVKFIVYQRQQIPYAYPWIKQAINKKKLKEENDGDVVKETFQSERHFRVASTTLESLDFVLKSLLQEINGSTIPDEVCIALGATPVTCKEVYRLILPTYCHKPQCHSTLIANDQKIQKTVFGSLVTAEKLSEVFFSQMSPTNMYVFIKKKMISNKDTIVSCENFQHTSGFMIPRKCKVIVIDFRAQNSDTTCCCNEIHIFGDATISASVPKVVKTIDNEEDDQFYEIDSTDTITWYQSSYVMKGFKDSVVGGSSIVNNWLRS